MLMLIPSEVTLRPKKNEGDKLEVKLSSHGTKICRKQNLIDFMFTHLIEHIATSSRGNHTIAILNVPENYDKLAIALIAEVENSLLYQFVVRNLKFSISCVAI